MTEPIRSGQKKRSRFPGWSERLTANFYKWERRGRGWDIWDEPVRLEPPFRPFVHSLAPPPKDLVDDGRRPTLGSRLADTMKAVGRWFMEQEPEPGQPPAIEEPKATPLSTHRPIEERIVETPADLEVRREVAESFLLSIPPATAPYAFELVGTPERITTRLAGREPSLSEATRQLRAHFPSVSIRPPEHSLGDLCHGPVYMSTVSFGLAREFMRPLHTSGRFKADPLSGLVTALSDLREREVAVLQVLFHPCRNQWAESILRSVTMPPRGGRSGQFGAVFGQTRRSFFANDPDMPRLAKEKVSRPLFAVSVRIAVRSPEKPRLEEIARGLASPLGQLSRPDSNELIPLGNGEQLTEERLRDVLARRSRRTGMLLNSEELLTLVHPPSRSVRSPKLIRCEQATKPAPEAAEGAGLVLGTNRHAGSEEVVTLSPDQRVRHIHLVGATGTGKSHLLANLIIQGLKTGEGLAVLDPHGDLIDRVMGHVPDERLEEAVLVDVADTNFPVGFNVLRAHSDLERTLLASDLVGVFRRLSSSWGDRMDSVLRNAVLAFVESEQGGTLFDLKRFLVEPDFRNKFLETVTDPQVRYYWEREFPQLKGRPHTPLLTRLDEFFAPKPVRYMVCQDDNRLDLGRAMDEGNIVLVRLSQGAIGERNAALLGTLLVAKLHQLALARQRVPESERRPFYLYIDEFQHFVTPSMARILSEARKYRLGLTLAHQELTQLKAKSPEVASAVLTHAYTRLCFRVGEQDARTLARGLSDFGAEDLQKLSVGEAVCRMERADGDFNLKTHPIQKVDEADDERRRERIRELARQRYATPRQEVVDALQIARGAPETDAKEPEGTEIGERPRAAEKRPEEAEATRTKEVTEETEALETPQGPREPPAPLGKGGERHRYLQNLVKRFGQDWGYKATIEKTLPSGGSVDVALERDGERVACEISVTSTPDQELGNVRKCLEAGFGEVMVLSPDASDLAKLREHVEAELDEDDRDRVRFLRPDRFPAFLEERAAEARSGETRVQGYKVNVEYETVDEGEKKSRSNVISKVVTQALKRLGGGQ